MTLVNGFTVEEDAQFELYGYYKIWWEAAGIWSNYYYTKTLVQRAVTDYIQKKGEGPSSKNYFIIVVTKLSYKT